MVAMGQTSDEQFYKRTGQRRWGIEGWKGRLGFSADCFVCLVPATCHTPSLFCDKPECPYPCDACILEGEMGSLVRRENAL